MPEVLTRVDEGDSIEKFKADRAGTGKCPRQWPCRYIDARQCAHDKMFGSECPKICDCKVCHGEQR